MEPITLNLPDLGQWAPYGWLAAYMLAVAFLGGLSYRHIRLAGVTKGEVQNAHSVTFVVSGLLAVVVFMVTLGSANELFNRSIRLADQSLEVVGREERLARWGDDLREREQFLILRESVP